jgi:hypothetical protein
MPQDLHFTGVLSGALTVAMVPVCGRQASAHEFALSMSGKVENRDRVGVSLEVKQFAGAGTYSFANGSGFVLVYGPPRDEYYVGSSSIARADTLTVNAGEKAGAVSVGFYTSGSAQQQSLRLIGNWRCQ